MRVPADVLIHQAQSRHYVGALGPWLEHLCEDEKFQLEQAREVLSRFEAIPYNDPVHGHMATLIKLNKEVHFAGYRKFRRRGFINPKRLREFLQPILDEETFLITKLAVGEDSKFIEHLGFEQIGATIDGMRTYILNEINYPSAKR